MRIYFDILPLTTGIALGCLGLVSGDDVTPAEAGRGLPVQIFLVDDQTGPELERDHQIKQLSATDLAVLVEAVTQRREPVRLMVQVVDEDASDNATPTMEFKPFAKARPVPPSDSLPYREYVAADEVYKKENTAWMMDMLAYRKGLQSKAEKFVIQVAKAQTTVIQRHTMMLSARNGADFNRSDISGLILNARDEFAPGGLRILVLNTDCNDLPMNGSSRTHSFSASELPEDIVVIFVNGSGLPDKSPLFSSVKNPKIHADTLKDAMTLVIKMAGAGNSTK